MFASSISSPFGTFLFQFSFANDPLLAVRTGDLAPGLDDLTFVDVFHQWWMKTVVPSFSGLWILLVEITKTRPLEKENVRLKRLLADEILGGSCWRKPSKAWLKMPKSGKNGWLNWSAGWSVYRQFPNQKLRKHLSNGMKNYPAAFGRWDMPT